MALRTAKCHRWPMTIMWGKGDGVTFTRRDRVLALALEYYEISLNAETGLSSYITTHPDYEGHFSVDDELPDDLAAQSLDRYRKAREKAENPIKPGERFYVKFDFDPRGGG